jgi:hypothetical protein
LRDAFRAAERQVEKHREKQEGDVKAHVAPPCRPRDAPVAQGRSWFHHLG